MQVAIYTNGGFGIGMGHIMRMCQFVKKASIKPVFYSLNEPAFRPGHAFLQKPVLLKDIKDLLSVKTDILLIDSPDIDEQLLSKLRKKYKLYLVDDEALLSFYDVDILINPNIYARELKYKGSNTHFIFSPLFLREEFLNKKIIIKKKLANIMLSLGGSDDLDLSSKITKLIYPFLQKNDIKLHIIQGPAFKKSLKPLENDDIKVYENAKMSDIMMKSDLALCACGQSIYEFLALGLPALGLCLAKNQENLVKYAKTRNFFVNTKLENILKDLSKIDYKKRLLIRKNIEKYFIYDDEQIKAIYKELLD